MDLAALPEGPPFALLKNEYDRWPAGRADELGYRFKGYRIDGSGVPEFLYRFDRFEVTDRFEPADDKGLRRQLLIRLAAADEKDVRTLWFRAHAGKHLRRTQSGLCADNTGLTSVLRKDTARLATFRHVGGQRDWIVPLEVDDTAMISLRYQW